MTAVVYPEEFDAGGSVVHWGEGEVEAAFFVGQVPGIQVFFAEGEIYFAQFVGLSFVKKYIFACGVCVSEAAAEIEAKDFSVQAAGAVAPVPFVVEGPDASSPVQDSEGAVFFEMPFFVCVFYKAFCCHAVDLVVVIKGVGVFVKGKINYEGIRIFSFQADAGFQIAPICR